MATNDDILARLQKLEDIEEIRNVKHKYFRAIDTADLELLRSILSEDFSADYKGGEYHWEIKGKATFVDEISKSFNSESVGCHNGHHPEITILSPTKAEGLWYLTDYYLNLRTRRITIGSALYKDTYEKVKGQWLIKEATYERIFEQDEPMERTPNLVSHMLAKTGRVLAAE